MGSSEFGIGEALKLERLRQKRSIDDVACETRISSRMLEAIERDDYDNLPGLLFARNFVKHYALALHIDPGPLLDAMPRPDISAAPLPLPPSHSPAIPAIPGWNPAWNGAISSVAWLVLAFTAATVAYIHFNRPLENQAAAARAAAQASRQAPSTQTTAAAPTGGDGGSSPAEAASGENNAAPLQNVGAPALPAADHLPLKSPAASANTAAPANEDSAAHKVNVQITAHEESWIQVSSDGKILFAGTLKPNESKEFSVDGALKLVAGNAGGITVSLNGRTLDRLGVSGQVRVLKLTEGGSQVALSAPPDPDRL